MRIHEIPLHLIRKENQFRKDIEDQALSLSIERQGLQKPLIVEGPTSNNEYILVEGYRRLYSLTQIGQSKAKCIIQELTNEEKRVIKRLSNELLNKKKTGYELERMIKFLLDKGYSTEQIARETNITVSTIKKHIKSLRIDQNIKKRAEKTGAGKDGLTRYCNLTNIKTRVKQLFMEKYINKELFSYHIDSIEHVVNNSYFKDLPEDSQEKCISQAIEQTKFTKSQAQEIVFIESLKQQNNNELRDHVFNLLCRSIKKIISYCHSNLINYLTKEQKQEIHKLIEMLARSAGMPIHWPYFPPDNLKKHDTSGFSNNSHMQ